MIQKSISTLRQPQKFEKLSNITDSRDIFFNILWPSENTLTLRKMIHSTVHRWQQQ